jgi:hypothetical protein
LLGEKLAPLLLQFPYLNQDVMLSCAPIATSPAAWSEAIEKTGRLAGQQVIDRCNLFTP